VLPFRNNLSQHCWARFGTLCGLINKAGTWLGPEDEALRTRT